MTNPTIMENLKKIKKASKERKIPLNHGNCGMFALAFHNYLKTQGISTKIGIFCASFDNDENNPEIFEELIFSDSPLYHVALIDENNNYYDADGCVQSDFIYKWIKKEYGEGKDYVAHYKLDMEKFHDKKAELEHYFRAETNYSLGVKGFKSLIDETLIDYKNEILSDLHQVQDYLNQKRIRLNSGNCGVFAIKFQEHLQNKGILTDFILFTKTESNSRDPMDILEDILLADNGLLHVALIDNHKQIYDADGCVDKTFIKKWINDEYSKDKKTQVYIIPNEYSLALKDVINMHTNYTHSAEDFKKFIDKVLIQSQESKTMTINQ